MKPNILFIKGFATTTKDYKDFIMFLSFFSEVTIYDEAQEVDLSNISAIVSHSYGVRRTVDLIVGNNLKIPVLLISPQIDNLILNFHLVFKSILLSIKTVLLKRNFSFLFRVRSVNLDAWKMNSSINDFSLIDNTVGIIITAKDSLVTVVKQLKCNKLLKNSKIIRIFKNDHNLLDIKSEEVARVIKTFLLDNHVLKV